MTHTVLVAFFDEPGSASRMAFFLLLFLISFDTLLC